jgi:hypothetical protein
MSYDEYRHATSIEALFALQTAFEMSFMRSNFELKLEPELYDRFILEVCKDVNETEEIKEATEFRIAGPMGYISVIKGS